MSLLIWLPPWTLPYSLPPCHYHLHDHRSLSLFGTFTSSIIPNSNLSTCQEHQEGHKVKLRDRTAVGVGGSERTTLSPLSSASSQPTPLSPSSSSPPKSKSPPRLHLLATVNFLIPSPAVASSADFSGRQPHRLYL